MDIDLNSLTLGEVEELEELCGRSIDTLLDGSKGRVMRALYWVVARRSDPSLTWEATANLSLVDVSAVLDPTKAATPS